MSLKARIAASAVTVLATGGLAFAALPASATTQTCNECLHVENAYYQGALDFEGQHTSINTPVIMWGETPATTDPGADLLVNTTPGTVPRKGNINQSHLDWSAYRGDSIVRFEDAPFGNTGPDTYLGLNGTSLALRHDNPHSQWQEFIEVPVSSTGVIDQSSTYASNANACEAAYGVSPSSFTTNLPNDTLVTLTAPTCMLVDVGQSVNPDDPMVVTNPGNSGIYSAVQQVVTPENPNQNNEIPSNQLWYFAN